MEFTAVEGFYGGAAGSEPLAVLSARETLAAGGNAFDAAISLYLTAAVTFPSSASLGGGGSCVTFDTSESRAEGLVFPAVASARRGASVERPSAVPAAIRGMYLLHARYGRLPWRRLVGSAEHLARLGFPVSRALARDLALVAVPLFADPEMKRIFARADGSPLREGDQLVQWDLAATLSLLRAQEPGEFYGGGFAKNMVAAVTAAGGSLDIEDLRQYRPEWRQTASLIFGLEKIHTLAQPSSGGATVLRMWSMLTEDDRYAEAGTDERAHLLVETSLRAALQRIEVAEPLSGDTAADTFGTEAAARLMKSYRPDRHVPTAELSANAFPYRENPAGMGFSVVDGEGSAIACVVTLNNLFGIGRMAKGTGIVIAAATSEGSVEPSLSPVVIVNHNVRDVHFAGAATGGAAAPMVMAEVMARILIEERPLREAIGAPRFYHGGAPDQVVHERTAGSDAVRGLDRRGHKLAPTTEIGRVDAIYCPRGARRQSRTCAFVSDTRGFGLATASQF